MLAWVLLFAEWVETHLVTRQWLKTDAPPTQRAHGVNVRHHSDLANHNTQWLLSQNVC